MRPRHRRRSDSAVGEVSINNFANAEKLSSRMKKSFSSNNQQLATLSQSKEPDPDEDVDWFDRDEDDIVAEVENLKVKDVKPDKEPESFSVQAFPYDFWFLLSGYIPPENIGTFAGISRVTKHIVSTQAFWRRLYLRYYDSDKAVPNIYKPEAMTRLLGYRTRVIKLLHLTYSPFQAKFASKSAIWPDLDVLVGRICNLQWTTKLSTNQCLLYFKLKDTKVLQEKSKHQDPFLEENEDISMDQRLLDDLSDIHYNKENGCKLLQVCAVSWCLVPPLLGQKLKSISVSVSHGMKHHKLSLEFGSPYTRRTDTRVVIDTVLNLKVINWWNPKYKEGPQQCCSLSRTDPFS